MKHATTVAVTGAGGFLGGHVCRILLDHGFSVVGIVRSGSDRKLPRDLDGRIEMRDTDLLDPSSVFAATEGADAVIHAAALVSIQSGTAKAAVDTNLNGTLNVIEACKGNGVGKLIHISSVHAFELTRGSHLDSDTPTATDSQIPYERTKSMAHEAVLSAMSDGSLGGAVISPCGLIGPFDDRPSIIGSLLLDIVNRKIPMLVNGGFWCTDVRDVAAAAARAITLQSDGNVYIAAGRHATLKQLADLCSGILGHNVTPREVPYAFAVAGLPFVRAYAAFKNISPLYSRNSLSMARDCPSTVDQIPAIQDLDYNIRPLKETIADALAWFRQSGLMS